MWVSWEEPSKKGPTARKKNPGREKMLVRDAMTIPVAGAKWMGVSRGAVFLQVPFRSLQKMGNPWRAEETSFKKISHVLTTDNPAASREAVTHLENHLGYPTGDEGDVDPGGGNETGNKKSYPKYILKVGGGGFIAKLCPTLATPWTVAWQAPLSVGFSRQEYWSGLPFPSPGDLPDPGSSWPWPRSPSLQADCLPTS